MSKVVSSVSIDLDAIETYTCSTYKELQVERFKLGLDYYICVITENSHEFSFDAAQFFEHCIREKSVINNPLTQSKVTSLQVFVSSVDTPEFRQVMTQEELTTYPNHLPIFWNDPSLNLSERLDFMVQYAKHYETIDREKANAIYEKAAQRGSLTANMKLVEYYWRKDPEKVLKHLQVIIENPECTCKNLSICAAKFMRLENYQLAYQASRLMALKGNLYGIGTVIQLLEEEKAQPSGDEAIAYWRDKLPSEWQSALITDFFQHLKETEYSMSMTH